MRRKLALITTGLLAGATLSVAGGTPAHAQQCESTGDPVLGYVCTIVNNAPEPGPTIDYYYWLATGTVHWAYCQVSPHC